MEAWRDTIPPEVFDQWMAFDQVEGDPLARVAEILKLGFAALVNCWGGEVRPNDFDPAAKDHPAAHVAVPAEAAAAMQAALSR